MSNRAIKITKYILLFFIVFMTTAFSNGKITGNIRDAATTDPLPYTNIIIVGTSLGTAADEDGKYTIPNIPPGNYTLRVSYVGYKQEEMEIEVQDGKVIEYNFELEPEGVVGDTLIVTAQAMGQKRAINEQLSSIAIKNVVSSARIQELPDANAAESVGRLPGVSIVRTGGEGSKVVVRGLSPQYNRVTIDGVEIPSNATSNDPDEHKNEFRNNESLSLSGDRATDLSMISSNMLGGIEVIKAITPDMDATVLGGVVNFSMRKAVKGMSSTPRFEVVSQGMYTELKDRYNYKLVGSYEQRFWDEKFGIFFQGSYEEKDLSSNTLDASYVFDGQLEDTDEGDPEFIDATLSDVIRDRNRIGATLVFDYQYGSGSIGLMNFYSNSATKADTRSERYHLEDDNLFFRGGYSESELDVISNLLSLKQNIGDFYIDLRLSHSYSGSKSPETISFNFWQDLAGFEDKYLTLRYSDLKRIKENVVYDYENADFFEISDVDNISKDRTYNAALDISKDLHISDYFTTKVEIGGAYQYRKRSYDYNERSGSVYYDDGGQVTAAILEKYPELGGSITYSDFIDMGYNYGDFFEGDYSLGDPMNIEMMKDVMRIARDNPGRGSGGGYKENKISTKLYDYDGHEVRSALFGMATFNIGQMFVVLPGVRYQNLETTYTGHRARQTSGNPQWSTVEKTESHGFILPMLHLRIKPLDWLQIHFAYTNTLNYPDYNTIIPRYYVGSNYIIYNNYELKPAKSENFDVILSMYSNEIGLFSIGGYKKTINDLIFTTKTYPSDFDDYPELKDDVDENQSYTLHTYVNNPHAIDVWGIETEWQTSFWYLPEPLNGIVLNVNYTHIFSEADYPKTTRKSYLDSNWVLRTISVDTTYSTRLLNQPNDILNIALGYDYAGFSFRISMLYQDNIFKNPDFWAQNREHSDKYFRVDLSVKQNLPWYGIQLFFNLNNITGEDDIDINQKTGYTTSQQRYGMAGDLGLRVRL